MILTGLDRLLQSPESLAGRRYGLLSNSAARSRDLQPVHLALLAAGASTPAVLLGPEHGFYGIEQDMIACADQIDPWIGIPILSLYGDSERSLRPDPETFRDLDLLVIDLQDVGARYYTYAASAIWSAETALRHDCEVWLLDRPNPLGGVEVEGNLPRDGFESFVGAFRLPVRHGLTLGELALLEAGRSGWPDGLRVWKLEGWRRQMCWTDWSRPWVAPSPNLPSAEIAFLYPGMCLVEATSLSEGRGTTRPFGLVGAPAVSPRDLADELTSRALPGVTFAPAYFRPQFQKHRGEVCGGVEVRVTDAGEFRPYRTGVELLVAVRKVSPRAFSWRPDPYEFVADRAVIDLLSGDRALREALEAGREPLAWIATWTRDEAAFKRERAAILLYPEAVEA